MNDQRKGLRGLIKKTGIITGLLYLASTLPFSIYQLHTINYGVEKRFGDIIHVEEKPGPHMVERWWIPYALIGGFPKVKRLDNRILPYIDSAENLPTSDRKFVNMTRYCEWRISDPELFENAVGSEEEAQGILDDVVFGGVWAKVGAHTFEENQTTMRDEIREKIIKTANDMLNQSGMEVVDIRIIKLNLPDEVRPKIHERMEAEQHKLAEEIRADGRSEKERIDGKQQREVDILLSEGQNKANKILGTAQRKVSVIYQQAYEDPDFFNFYKTMETYKEIAKKNKENGIKPKVILSNDNPLLELLLNGGEIPKDLEQITQESEKKD